MPGSFFIIFGLWWSYITAIRYVQVKLKAPHAKYKATVWMPCVCCPCQSLRRAPIESMLKIFFTSVGILGEVLTGFGTVSIPKYPVATTMSQMANEQEHAHGRASDILNSTLAHPEMIEIWKFAPANGQHITMYTGFLLGAIVEILVYKKYDIPAKLDWLMGGIAFGAEAYLFAFHLHGKDPLEVHIHVLLVYSILGCVLCGLFEMIYQDQVLFTYGRILFTVLQGTWFFQIGFVLYPPTDAPSWQWNPYEHDQIMAITMSFIWHIFIIMTFLLVQMWIIKRMYLASRRMSTRFDELLVIDGNSYSDAKHDGVETTHFLRLLSDEESADEKVQFSSLALKENSARSASTK